MPEITAEDTDSVHTHRDELELEQLIEYNSDRQQELSSIVTDLNKEPENITTMGKQVLEFLSRAESYNTLSIVLSDDWYPTMLTEDLVIGQRNYHLDGELSGDITVLSDELGNHYTFIRSFSQTYGLSYLEVGPETIRFMVKNGPEKEQYFVVQTLYTSDGSFISNEGFISDAGLIVDDLVVYVSDLMMESETADENDQESGLTLIDAWAKRYDNGFTYNGSFTEEGKTTVETPEELAVQGDLCYAFQNRGSDALYLYIEDTPDHIFTGNEFGVFTIWDE